MGAVVTPAPAALRADEIVSSLDLSAAGFHVYLVEQDASIGGGMARLDKTFPTGDCATCIISPKLVECMRDLNIDVMTMSDVVELDGEAGDFKAQILTRPRGVDIDKCTGCGDCWQACPVHNVPQIPEPFTPSQPLDAHETAWLEGLFERYRGEEIDLTDGVRVQWPGQWLHVRASNTEPVIRVIAEGEDEDRVDRLFRNTLLSVKTVVHGKS